MCPGSGGRGRRDMGVSSWLCIQVPSPEGPTVCAGT
jgi:hypothetical protein